MSYIKSLFIINLFILFSVGLVYSQNPEWVVYDTSNSGLPSNGTNCIVIDDSGNKWISSGGLARFDGINWTVYGFSTNSISCIAIDDSGNKWIGTYSNWPPFPAGLGQIGKFDGTNWTVYGMGNFRCITIDDSGHHAAYYENTRSRRT